MAFAGIIFDMDGTLLDTEQLALRAWNETERRTGTAFPPDFVYSIVGANSATSHRLAGEALGSEERAEAFFAAFREVYQKLLAKGGPPIKPGAGELLRWSREAGLRLALATSTRREVTRSKLKETGLEHFFEAVVCGDEVTRGKPDPEIFARAAAALELPCDKLVAVEDSPNGLRSATAAGLRTILVPDLAPVSDEVRTLAWRVVADLTAVRTVLEEALSQ